MLLVDQPPGGSMDADDTASVELVMAVKVQDVQTVLVLVW